MIASEKCVFQVSQGEGQSCKKINARWLRAPINRTESILGRKALFFTTEDVSSPEKGFFFSLNHVKITSPAGAERCWSGRSGSPAKRLYQ